MLLLIGLFVTATSSPILANMRYGLSVLQVDVGFTFRAEMMNDLMVSLVLDLFVSQDVLQDVLQDTRSGGASSANSRCICLVMRRRIGLGTEFWENVPE